MPDSKHSVIDHLAAFSQEKAKNISRLADDNELQRLSVEWMVRTSRYSYSYNFNWLGLPVIQFPQDMVAMQELIWRIKPDLIIETGIARGGSLIFYASMLELIGENGTVLGIDIDVRDHNRSEIEKHPMSKRLTMMEGSSVDASTAKSVFDFAAGRKNILLVLDSNHTHDHVLKELELYSPLVGKGSYVVVFDTIIEDMPEDFFADRPWGKGNNPKTAVHEFLRANNRFEIDEEIPYKLLITVAPDGYLKCVAD